MEHAGRDGETADRLRRYREDEAKYRAAGDRQRIAHTIRHIADIFRREGNYRAAEEPYAEALRIYRSAPETTPLDLANALRGAAILRSLTGRVEESIGMWREAGGIYRDLGIDAGVEESERQLASMGSSEPFE